MTDDPDHPRMAELYDQAIDTDIAKQMVGRLAHCHIVNRLTNGDLNVAIDVMGDPGTDAAAQTEFDALNDQEREDLAALVRRDLTVAISGAILRLWHACRLLNHDPEGLDPRYVVLVASTLISDEADT
jgi:hypothetical protein